MSTRPPDDSTGPLDHLSIRYLRQAIETPHPTDEPYVLNDIESRVIRRTKTVVLTLSALLGAFGVVLFYIPQHNWPELFSTTSISILSWSFELSIVNTLYALLLIYLGVSMLMIVSEWGVQMVMEICQFPQAHDAQYERHIQVLADKVGNRPWTSFLRQGLDIYLTMPRWGLSIFFLLNILKAILITVGIRFLVAQYMGDYSFEEEIELGCVAIVSFWSSWASWQVVHEAQIRVMAPVTIRGFVDELYEECGKNEEFALIIMQLLQYMIVTARPANYAQYLLVETIVDRFRLTNNASFNGHFPNDAATVPAAIHRSLERLAVFAALIDGQLQWGEKFRLHTLRRKGFLAYSGSEVKRISYEYNQGRGLWV